MLVNGSPADRSCTPCEGGVAVIARGPEFKLLALNQLDDGFDASPVVVGNVLYLRGRKHLYRISKE